MIGALQKASRDFITRWKEAHAAAPTRSRHAQASLALALCLLIIVTAIFGDEQIARRMKDVSPVLYDFMSDVTRLGESGWIFASCAVAIIGALALRHRGSGLRVDAMLGLFAGRAFFILSVNAVAGLVALLIKSLVGRARPRLLDVVGPFHFDAFALNSSFVSFPSGHSVTAFASATAFLFLAPRLGKWLLVLAVMIALSRVITGAHYPSDIIAGAALGAATSIFLRRAFAARDIVFSLRPDGCIELRAAGLITSAWSGVSGIGAKK